MSLWIYNGACPAAAQDHAEDFQEETDLEGSGQAAPQPEPVAAETKPASKPKVTRERKAEGTKAADRFRDVRVIKSRYTNNGKQLEVDPD